MLVLSSPSGAGKTTLSRRLMARDRNLVMSVSVTTRPPRPGEKDGSDYYFLSVQEFDRLLAEDGLLEWAEVFGNRYGTPRKPVEEALAEGRDMLFDIDWQGTQQLAGKMAADLVRIFILPPTAEDLRQRLIQRAEDSFSEIAKRMAEAASEISHWAEYDYVLINDDLERCDRAISSILHAERLRQNRRTGLSDFVRGLQDSL
ncbi:MAG: guanylate kinase [Hyphomicrobiales bacterium]